MSLPANIPNAFTSDCCECGPFVWFSGEYLLWWTKSPRLSTSVITTNAAPPVGNNPVTGLLGQEGTIVLAGPDRLNFNPSSGARLSTGVYLDGRQTYSIEGSAFFLERKNVSYAAASNAAGTPLIFVPFFDNQGNREFGFANAIPDFRTGSVQVNVENRFWGAEANYVARCFQCCGCIGASFLAGFRYYDMDEKLTIDQRSNAIDGASVAFGVPFPTPQGIAVRDTFDARNQFFGGQLGVRVAASWRQIFFAAQGKCALGTTHQVLNVNGISTLNFPSVTGGGVTVPLPPATVPGGRFAVPTNSGRFVQDQFTVIPEVEGRVGVQIHPAAILFLGYNFIYMNRVVRPGDQLDRVIDLTQVPTAFEYNPAVPVNRPRVPMQQSFFWAQGFDLGLEITY